MNWTPLVDVIIPCYNVEHIVENCISSVLNQQYQRDFNIFLVNDGSTDQTGTILDSFHSHSHIKIIHLEKNGGLSTARNEGINAGNGEVVLFLDSDMVVQDNWINEHIRALGQNNIVGVIGDSILPKEIKPNVLDKYLYGLRRGARQFGENTSISFHYFLFNNTSVKRAIFDVVELFDENITSYGGEDTELAIRLWEAYPDGLRFSFTASSEHHHQRELKDFCQSMHHYGKNNLPILLGKYPAYLSDLGGDWIYTLKGFVLFNPIIRWFVEILNRYRPNYFLTRYMLIDAVVRGARSSTLS